MNIDTENIVALLAAGKTDEAKKALEVALSGDLTEEEKGSVLLAVAQAHAEVSARADRTHAAVLKDASETLSKLATAAEDVVALKKEAAIRQQLA